MLKYLFLSIILLQLTPLPPKNSSLSVIKFKLKEENTTNPSLKNNNEQNNEPKNILDLMEQDNKKKRKMVHFYFIF